MLRASDVRKTFDGVTALERVNLTVAPGEIVGLVGPNGSGKSTLLEILCGRLRPDAGSVSMDGRTLRIERNDFSSPVAVFRTHQRARIFPQHSVLENMQLGQWAIRNGNAEGLAPTVFPNGRMKQLAGDLSIGEKRKIVLAWLWNWIDSVSYFLLDEPCAGGDEAYKNELIQFVTAARVKRKGVLWVEHDRKLLDSHSDRIVSLVAGWSVDSHWFAAPENCAAVTNDADSRMPHNSLAATELTVARGQSKILQQVSVEVRSGEVVALLGPNGIGKSTLLASLYGYPELQVLGGVVRHGDVLLHPSKISERLQHGIHLLPQEGGVFSSLTVREFIQASVEAVCQTQVPDDKMRTIIKILPHLARILHRRCGVLSGGERRIAGLARIVALSPQFALLDEPSAGLDTETRESVGVVIRMLASAGTGVLLAEQNRFFAAACADRVVELAPLNRT
jgi:branched-chain amino acid transport system ATP-binding protein